MTADTNTSDRYGNNTVKWWTADNGNNGLGSRLILRAYCRYMEIQEVQE
jgi:hypothetical protein